MRLIKTRVRCVQGVEDTGWFIPGRKTTVIYTPSHSEGTSLLRALQALNPPYDIIKERVLADHPAVWHQGMYSKRVFPAKKTAVFMIFSAEPKHVAVLGGIDPDLIETDRIEVGRRLDYSRWTSFVEISASCRWQEVAEPMQRLHARFAGRTDLPDATFLTRLGPQDRLKGEAAAACLRWLQAIGPLVVPEEREVYRDCLARAGRRERFRQAENQVAEWLPLTLYLDPDEEVQSVYSFAEIFAERPRGQLPTVTALLRLLCNRLQLPGPDGGQNEAVRQAMDKAETLRRRFSQSGLTPPPGFHLDQHRLYLDGLDGQHRLERRKRLLALTCLLAELGHGHRPILLLDGFDRGLSPEPRLELAKYQQRLGELYQLLATTEYEEVSDAAGWQTAVRIGPGGLLGAKQTVA